MGKLIIDNRSSLSDCSALSACMDVVKAGRISGEGDKKQYCYGTKVPMIGVTDLMIYADLNKQSDRLIVMDAGT